MHYITLYNRPAISRHKEKFASIWVPVQDDYPVAVHEGDGGPQVRCADVPEMVCAGDTVEQALFDSVDALGSALSFYVDQRIAIPLPSPAVPGQPVVRLPGWTAAKASNYRWLQLRRKGPLYTQYVKNERTRQSVFFVVPETLKTVSANL